MGFFDDLSGPMMTFSQNHRIRRIAEFAACLMFCYLLRFRSIGWMGDMNVRLLNSILALRVSSAISRQRYPTLPRLYKKEDVPGDLSDLPEVRHEVGWKR